MNTSSDRHTFHRFDEELDNLHAKVGEMGELVLNQLCLAVEAIKNKDLALARKIIARERLVNEQEVGADTEICAILARRCPVAGDLRAVMAASKIVNNLERIGDEAAKLANFTNFLQSQAAKETECFPLDAIYKLGGISIDIVQSALAVFKSQDREKINEVGDFHRALDHEFQSCLHRLMNWLQEDKHNVGNAVSQVLIMKALERVGDHAQNIAEYVVYQLEGEDIRHQTPDFAGDFPFPE